jgi:O-acetyl-ADP-ribose deacetylase (regulator of RNase III)
LPAWRRFFVNSYVASYFHAVSLPAATIELMVGDITAIPVDAIVNAANSALAGGGGVDGAIHRAGGPSVMEELDGIRVQIGHCPTGKAVVTGAGRLPARYVFHAVGPVYRGGGRGEKELLRSCYTTCLELARERDLETISFPSISTGVYGYPIDEAAQVAFTTAYDWLTADPGTVQVVKLVQFSERDYAVYLRTVTKAQI